MTAHTPHLETDTNDLLSATEATAVDSEATPIDEADAPDTASEPIENAEAAETQQASKTTAQSTADDRVPLPAFLEEKKRRKAIQQKMSRMEDTFQTVLERLQGLSDAQKKSAELDTAPSYEEDPIGALAYQQQRLQLDMAQHKAALKARDEQASQVAAVQTLVGEYKEAAETYQTEQPDFKDAYQFLVHAKLKEYQAFGLSQSEALKKLQSEELQLAERAFQEEVNPAERLYKMALAQGYQTAQKTQQLDGAQKVEQLAQGLKQNQSLSAVGGKPAAGQITLERLAEMDAHDPEFDKYWRQLIG